MSATKTLIAAVAFAAAATANTTYAQGYPVPRVPGFPGTPMGALPYAPPGAGMPYVPPGAGMPYVPPGGAPIPAPYPPSPQGVAYGQAAATLGFNHEHKVAAECVGQFGVSKPAAACLTARLTVEELNKCFSDGIGGRGCFGDNNTLANAVRRNLEIAKRESGVIDQLIAVPTGISVPDIKRCGLAGGNNSVLRKIVGGHCD